MNSGDLLDIVVNYTTSVQKINTREQEAHPFFRFGFFYFHRHESWKVGPVKSRKFRISFSNVI